MTETIFENEDEREEALAAGLAEESDEIWRSRVAGDQGRRAGAVGARERGDAHDLSPVAGAAHGVHSQLFILNIISSLSSCHHSSSSRWFLRPSSAVPSLHHRVGLPLPDWPKPSPYFQAQRASTLFPRTRHGLRR